MKCFLVFYSYAANSRTSLIENDKESPYRQRLKHATSSSTACSSVAYVDMLFMLLIGYGLQCGETNHANLCI